MNRGNSKKVMANAITIVAQFKAGQAITSLMKKFHCGYYVLKRDILTHISPSQYWRFCKRNMSRGGVETRLKQGHATWNKGMKGWSPQGSEATRFKKGYLPAQHQHKGTIRIRTNSNGKQYSFIKVLGIIDGVHRWRLYARYIWEQHYGPIPKGRLIIHKDGDPLNDSIDNLLMIIRNQLPIVQRQIDPLLEKRRLRASIAAAKKRGKANRKARAKAAKQAGRQAVLAARDAVIDAKEKRAVLTALRHVTIPDIERWECISCGFDFNKQPPDKCPKCSRSSFEKVKIKQRLAI